MRAVIAAIAVVALAVGVGVVHAAPDGGTGKLAYTETVVSTGDLSVSFDEAGQKRFDSADYRLDATLIVSYTCQGQSLSFLSSPTATVSGLVPDGRGHVLGTATLDAEVDPGTLCPGVSASFDYTSVKLTNLSSGRVYGLASISRALP